VCGAVFPAPGLEDRPARRFCCPAPSPTVGE